MSDREGRGAPANDDDLSLPRATVAKMIQGILVFRAPFSRLTSNFIELLPDEVSCAKETRDLVIECCVGELPLVLSLFTNYADRPRIQSLSI